MSHVTDHKECVAVRCSALQCVAVRCSVLQCVAVYCSVWQCVAVCCSVLQCVAVCCSVLQCVAVYFCALYRLQGAPSHIWRMHSSRIHQTNHAHYCATSHGSFILIYIIYVNTFLFKCVKFESNANVTFTKSQVYIEICTDISISLYFYIVVFPYNSVFSSTSHGKLCRLCVVRHE